MKNVWNLYIKLYDERSIYNWYYSEHPLEVLVVALKTCTHRWSGGDSVEGIVKEKMHPSIRTRIDDVILGCANQSGEDNRNVSRMAFTYGWLSDQCSRETINRLCVSGLSACIAASRGIMVGDLELVVAGGVENMTRGSGYFLKHLRLMVEMHKCLIQVLVGDSSTRYLKKSMGQMLWGDGGKSGWTGSYQQGRSGCICCLESTESKKLYVTADDWRRKLLLLKFRAKKER